MYSTYVGQNNSLVFPVMCSGYVKLDYSDNVVDDAGTDNVYGIWDNEYRNFTFEAIVTPYEVVGNTAYPNNDSTKIMPSRSTGDGFSYLSSSNRLDHEMCLYSSSSLEIRLANAQSSRSAYSAAEYRIETTILLGSTEYTCNSSTCIVPDLGKRHRHIYGSSNNIKENIYSHTQFHILVSYDNVNKDCLIFVNGVKVGSSTFDTTDSFAMAEEDIYIGVDHAQFSNASAFTRKQFMGEIHELAIQNIAIKDARRKLTLSPQLHNTLLYLRFEEVVE